VTLIATSDPQMFPQLRPHLEERLGALAMVLSTRDDLHRMVNGTRKRHLALAAEHRAPLHESCRSLNSAGMTWAGASLAACLTVALILTPALSVPVLSLLALLVLLVNTGFAAAMGALWLINRRRTPAARATQPPARPVPVSLLVPLFKEKQIA